MFILWLFATVAYAQDLLVVEVNTTEGVVQGFVASGDNYYTFYDIPYAGPTSGENRFKAPTSAVPYNGIFNATINRNTICAQPTSQGLIGIEDCLTLSIFTPSVRTPKPVFVWVNAEEYTTTTIAAHSYSKIMERNFVFVSLNFRLSVFGFLCLRIEEAPGNAGLKDIIQGLHWIKNNIANFGGDPNNVVLIGHGSGAALVDLVTLSPRSENLVNKAIALSGSSLAPWAVAYDPIGYANLLGAALNYTNETPEQLAALLKTTNINVMASALSNFKFTNNTPLFAPCLENFELNPKETILFDAPINILKSGNFSDIPYIFGYTSREGTLRANEAVNEQWLSRMQANFADFLPVDINVALNASITEKIREFYFNGNLINMTTINAYLNYHGDTLVLTSVIRSARERSRTSEENVRLLEFGYIGTKNTDWPHIEIPLTGARHGAFMNYLFDYDLFLLDGPVTNALLTRFSTFVHDRDMSPADLATFWPAVNSTSFQSLRFTGRHVTEYNAVLGVSIRVTPYIVRINFWDDIYSRYYVAPQGVGSSANIAFVAMSLVVLCQFYLRFV